ncbi:MAG: circadian clock protein KaiC, partial [Myxococcota bacterium]
VIILRNQLNQENRRRTIEILKFRGTTHMKGEYPFTIDADNGITIIPLSALELTQSSSAVRVPSGNENLDAMCGGGLFRDSIILVSGATGTGKTLMVTEFIQSAIKRGEPSILFAFEESREQLTRNAEAWGVNLEEAEQQGLVRLICHYPESRGLEDHLIAIKEQIEVFKPGRIAVDSLSALERVATAKSFREFVIGLTSYVKRREMTGMLTNTTSTILGGESITETHISTITDAIILLRYVELFGEMHRGLTVLKMRGSWHDNRIREYSVGADGMTLKGPFIGVQGILSGEVRYTPQNERDLLRGMFADGSEP